MVDPQSIISGMQQVPTTCGSYLAGTFMSLVLYGLSVFHTEDKAHLKLAVALLFLVDTVHQVFVCIGTWTYLVTNFGSYSYVTQLNTFTMLGVVCQGLTGFIAQSFFTWRIWRLSGAWMRWIIPTMIMPFVIVQPIFVGEALADSTGVSAVEGTSLRQYIEAFCGSAAGVDIVIAVVMCILLYMGRTGFNKNTDRMLLRLMIISVNTGLWTALLGVLVIILLVALPTSNRAYIAVCFPLSTLYCNTMLANLNARSYVRNVDSMPLEHISTLNASRKSPTPVLNISVDTTKWEEYDSVGHDTVVDAPLRLKV
ncbi:hypothetical protein BV22DRAFT_691933 [Leucogyrophana mollusca]|uniref:Uncharacterized protein n=1 Tax=Leucogyrophana mollusca TaxID=85980 RepID=A0ACB8B9E5_9AGAM|nr:hypothetical protein BV22DRAFT_691933 [Leucogyrophana mollusca]